MQPCWVHLIIIKIRLWYHSDTLSGIYINGSYLIHKAFEVTLPLYIQRIKGSCILGCRPIRWDDTHQYIHVLLSFIGKITDSLMTCFYLPWNCWLLYDWKQNSEPFTRRAEELNCLGVWKCLLFSLSNHQHSQNLIGWFFSLSNHSNVLLESNNDVSDQPSPSTT